MKSYPEKRNRERKFFDVLLILIGIGLLIAIFSNEIMGFIFPNEFGIENLDWIIFFAALLVLFIFICSLVFYIKTIIAMYKTKNYVWLILSIIGLIIILFRFFIGSGDTFYGTDVVTGQTGEWSLFGLTEVILSIVVNIAFYLLVYRKKLSNKHTKPI